MAKVLDEIQKLMRLALDPGTPENEARNAAMLALRRIQKHDVLLVLASDEPDSDPLWWMFADLARPPARKKQAEPPTPTPKVCRCGNLLDWHVWPKDYGKSACSDCGGARCKNCCLFG